MKRIGLIAGSGQFPLIWARTARLQGYEVVAAAHIGETSSELEGVASSLFWVQLGELEKIIETFRKSDVKEVALAGGIRKSRIFTDARPDSRAMALLSRIGPLKDDTLLRAFSAELEREGLSVIESTVFLSSLLTPPGRLTSRPPTSLEEKDIAYGFGLAKEVGRLEIGQCVVVKNQAILAVEAMEGTGEAIRRGGRLAKNGAVVVKASKPQQDFRFDLPAAGPETISVMEEVGASVLAMEAGRSLLLEKEELLKRAEKSGISVVGWKESQ